VFPEKGKAVMKGRQALQETLETCHCNFFTVNNANSVALLMACPRYKITTLETGNT
jgi:hypothetical protein